ncbi:MAG: radical SAM protein [Candidatus Thorarchaeota archaeon]|nr:radical SAM protein [Candidatus Thorarchaeota archaeon]
MNTEDQAINIPQQEDLESPQYVRTSLAAAMTMGKIPGKFYRDAKLYCINILLTYNEGCHAKCAYCGLSGSRVTETDWTDNSFIRVDWPIFSVDDVKRSLVDGTAPHVERVCVSMITLGKARDDCIEVVRQLSEATSNISILITPTIINKDWLEEAKRAGADKVGIAVDAATPEIFDRLRGMGVKGPHKWEKYWRTVDESIEVFGAENVGIHLIVGLGETEEEIIKTIQRAQDLGARTHLFSFFPEAGSQMENWPQPPLGAYRRVQLARYIINKNLGNAADMRFNELGQLTSFGVSDELLEQLLTEGEAFMTSGCSGDTMDNACNRPFGNCTPYQASIGHWRNFPMRPTPEDMKIVRGQLWDYALEYIEPTEVDLNLE